MIFPQIFADEGKEKIFLYCRFKQRRKKDERFFFKDTL